MFHFFVHRGPTEPVGPAWQSTQPTPPDSRRSSLPFGKHFDQIIKLRKALIILFVDIFISFCTKCFVDIFGSLTNRFYMVWNAWF